MRRDVSYQDIGINTGGSRWFRPFMPTASSNALHDDSILQCESRGMLVLNCKERGVGACDCTDFGGYSELSEDSELMGPPDGVTVSSPCMRDNAFPHTDRSESSMGILTRSSHDYGDFVQYVWS